jgi:ABC-type Fe3+/spermidine/putrescine transport system ATPase subunit
LATQPRVVLLDEPLGALDKKLRDEMQIELKKIQREVGITTIFVTHDQDEALIMADRVAIIDGGRVVQVGTPREVYEQPQTRFAASFLGDSNFLPGKVSGRANGLTQVTLEDGQIIYSSHGTAKQSGEKVTAAVRPERLHATTAGATQNLANRVTGRIAQEVYTGNSITYKIEVGSQYLNLFLQNSNGCAFTLGQQAVVEWNPADTLLVD